MLAPGRAAPSARWRQRFEHRGVLLQQRYRCAQRECRGHQLLELKVGRRVGWRVGGVWGGVWCWGVEVLRCRVSGTTHYSLLTTRCLLLTIMSTYFLLLTA